MGNSNLLTLLEDDRETLAFLIKLDLSNNEFWKIFRYCNRLESIAIIWTSLDLLDSFEIFWILLEFFRIKVFWNLLNRIHW